MTAEELFSALAVYDVTSTESSAPLWRVRCETDRAPSDGDAVLQKWDINSPGYKTFAVANTTFVVHLVDENVDVRFRDEIGFAIFSASRAEAATKALRERWISIFEKPPKTLPFVIASDLFNTYHYALWPRENFYEESVNFIDWEMAGDWEGYVAAQNFDEWVCALVSDLRNGGDFLSQGNRIDRF